MTADDSGSRERDAAHRRAILAGDLEGLRVFHAAHLRPLYAFCLARLGRDHHAAEEVVQETFTRALERIEQFDPDRGELRTWLAWLARNAIRRANQERRRFQGTEARELALVASPAALARGPDDFDDLDALALVEPVLARLPDHYRLVLERKYLLGEPVRAIAESSATTEKAVESLLARAREAFRATYVSLASPTVPASPRTEQLS